jgi:hypothetical protein
LRCCAARYAGLGAYAILTRCPTIRKLAVLSVVFGAPAIGFALAYV